MPASLTLVIPVYNSAEYLHATLQKVYVWLEGLDRKTELLIVDDGSSDGSAAVCEEFLKELKRGEHARPRKENLEATKLRVLRNSPNQGKGFSVRRGMLCASSDLVVFTDADLTYPVENIESLLATLEEGNDVVIGSRMHRDSRYIVAPSFFRYLYTRHAMGRFFNLLVRLFVVPQVFDTQAGLKGTTREAARKIFPRGRLMRFSFDVEILFIARRLGLRIAESPVTFVYRKEPSTVNFFKDSLHMLLDMARVRYRALRGRYERETSPEAILQHPACLEEELKGP